MTSTAPRTTRILANLGPAKLVEYAIRRGEGHLTDRGAFTAVTVPHTGRSPKDKFVVDDGTTAGAVWWDKNARMSPAHFELLQADVEGEPVDDLIILGMAALTLIAGVARREIPLARTHWSF